MINKLKQLASLMAIATGVLMAACHENMDHAQTVSEYPDIVPDYTNVTIPASIVPLNFTVQEPFERINAVIEGIHGERIELQGKKNIRIPIKEWHT
ncbi:Protein TolB, partial [termite gut metagenome]